MIKKEELSKESQALLDKISASVEEVMSNATRILLIECFFGDKHPQKVMPLLNDVLHKAFLFTKDLTVHKTPESVQ